MKLATIILISQLGESEVQRVTGPRPTWLWETELDLNPLLICEGQVPQVPGQPTRPCPGTAGQWGGNAQDTSLGTFSVQLWVASSLTLHPSPDVSPLADEEVSSHGHFSILK